MNPAATAYLQLGAAIVVEVAATAFLKQSDGMSRLLPTVASLLGYGISFFLLSIIFGSSVFGELIFNTSIPFSSSSSDASI